MTYVEKLEMEMLKNQLHDMEQSRDFWKSKAERLAEKLKKERKDKKHEVHRAVEG